MLSGATQKPIVLAEKRINRVPYSIYVRVVRVDTLDGIKFRFDMTSNATHGHDFSVLYDDQDRAMSDFRHAVANYAHLPGAEHDSIGTLR